MVIVVIWLFIENIFIRNRQRNLWNEFYRYTGLTDKEMIDDIHE